MNMRKNLEPVFLVALATSYGTWRGSMSLRVGDRPPKDLSTIVLLRVALALYSPDASSLEN
jgi:hypothetical protein